MDHDFTGPLEISLRSDVLSANGAFRPAGILTS